MSHHDPFKALSPLSWQTDIAPRDPAALADLFTSTFADAQLLVNSIPSLPATPNLTTTGRARSHTDSSVPPPHILNTSSSSSLKTNHASRSGGGGGGGARKEEDEMIKKLAREWKDLKTQSNNPHGIAMHKLAAKDGKGAWFARRSLHRGEPFEKWEVALRREMGETLGQGGGVRGLGAERRVASLDMDGGGEEEEGQGKGKGGLEVYQVSVRFPGPTTPRDFVTVLMMPAPSSPDRRGGRQFMIVSRPVEHPDCPPRSGFIRGQYESVEVIREVAVAVERPLRRTRSSVDFSRDELKGGEHEHLSREAVLRAAKKAVGEEAESEGEQGKAVAFVKSVEGGDGDVEMAVEWLMVTRSDPGGSVPRFMVERGTPGGVISDAGKFLKWLSSQSLEDLTAPRGEGEDQQETSSAGVEQTEQQPPATTPSQDHLRNGDTGHHNEPPPASGTGIYGLLTSALGAASSAVASRVAAFAPSSTEITDSDASDDESISSEGSFASAEEGSAPNHHPNPMESTSALDAASIQSTHSTFSSTAPLSRSATPLSHAQTQHEKELGKLQQRMQKAKEKLERTQARRLAKRSSNTSNPEVDGAKETEKDDQALAKLREKHARELAKQQDKYQRELERLATKRAAEERKKAERRKKAAEREEKADLQMELERVKAERDVARKEIEMLRERVGELQGQNTMLVARLGREGLLPAKGEGLYSQGK